MAFKEYLGAIGTGVGMISDTLRQGQQYSQQKKLMELQMQNQMKLNLQNQKIQQENWDYTNYENQMKHIENAGLSAGLIYGGSGAGGATMGGGTYNDYLEVQYDENSRRMYEHPIYVGGKIRELAFQEVISQSSTTFEGVPQPLGQLAGKGVVAGKNKGGKITVKCTEPCYIMGSVS